MAHCFQNNYMKPKTRKLKKQDKISKQKSTGFAPKNHSFLRHKISLVHPSESLRLKNKVALNRKTTGGTFVSNEQQKQTHIQIMELRDAELIIFSKIFAI